MRNIFNVFKTGLIFMLLIGASFSYAEKRELILDDEQIYFDTETTYFEVDCRKNFLGFYKHDVLFELDLWLSPII